METILITGINGFLGSNLARSLSPRFNVIGLEHSLTNLSRLEGCSFEVYQFDEQSIKKLFANHRVDIVIHTATFYGRGSEDILQIASSNLFMPLRVLDCAIRYKVSTFINTDTVLDRFVSTYALTKNQFREWLYLRRAEIQCINMQLEHFYGRGCPETNFITKMIALLKANVKEIDLTHGEQERDFIYYQDIITAFVHVIDSLGMIDKGYSEFQVGSGETIKIKELMLLLKELTHADTKLNFGVIPYRENELMKSETDIRLLRNIGWSPAYSIRAGVSETVNIN